MAKLMANKMSSIGINDSYCDSKLCAHDRTLQLFQVSSRGVVKGSEKRFISDRALQSRA